MDLIKAIVYPFAALLVFMVIYWVFSPTTALVVLGFLFVWEVAEGYKKTGG